MNQYPRLFVYLAGGLGNQMFQYACARSLSLRRGVELVLDNWSGFATDFQYRRRYELGALPVQARLAYPWERWPIWLHRWRHRRGRPQAGFLEEAWNRIFIYETEYAWLPLLGEVPLQRTAWISGYWQSPRYFSEYTDQICCELMPPPASQPHFVALANQLVATESVALGLRFYEESKDPNAHAGNKRLKNAFQIRAAVTRLRSIRPRAKFFVFCTHRHRILKELNLPKDATYVTHDDGYTGSVERLWLLSQCRHHLFTNSSFYWWGAWLSRAVRGIEGQTILAANNFSNRDSLCPGWESF